MEGVVQTGFSRVNHLVKLTEIIRGCYGPEITRNHARSNSRSSERVKDSARAVVRVCDEVLRLGVL